MIDIVTADLKTKAYKDFKDLLIEEWGQVDQLPEFGHECAIPLPLLAFQEETLTGGLSFIEFESPEASQLALWINAVYISSVFRGKGIASQLIEQAVQVAKIHGESTLYVYTDKKSLYLKLGWKLLSEKDNDCVLKMDLS